MSLHKLTYQFDTSGGNIQYQTIQQVQRDADTHPTPVTLVTTGLSRIPEGIVGTAIVEVEAGVAPGAVFESATAVRAVPSVDISERPASEPQQDLAGDPQPAVDIPRLEDNPKLTALLERLNETPGWGCLLYSNLTRCYPHERDLWLVNVHSTELKRATELTNRDLIAFYREHLDLLEENPALKIGVFHGAVESTIQLSVVASLTDRQEARELAEQASNAGVMNAYRFELSKESLVVGTATHGPGQVEAVFRNGSGDEVCSRALVYRIWHEGLEVSVHPLGIIVDGELYRPVLASSHVAPTSVGEPLQVATYRGGTGKPWQFGVTRHDDELLITQARASPEKFDPVLKRLPIETQSIGDDPLVLSHMVSRRVWSEDPLTPQVQSQRSEGLVTQFLYADSEGWHLIQPRALGEPAAPTDASFASTQLAGVSVRSSLLRAESDGETKATVEHEYRITAQALEACRSLYALSYYEANEESIGRLQWDIADATAYEVVREQSPPR